MGIFTWIAILTLLFYLTPFTRHASRPVRAFLQREKKRNFPYSPFLLKVGRWEYFLGHLRDRILSIILLAVVIYLWITEDPLQIDTLIASTLIILYNLLAIIDIRYRDGIRMKLAELARIHSNIHPEDFFNLYYVMLSPWPPPFPSVGFRLVAYNDADYRSGGKPTQTFWPLLEAIWMTNTLARMAIMSFQRIGTDYGRDAFDGLARLWGSCTARIIKGRMKTIGVDQIPPLQGKTLLLFNHKSTLDFALNFFSLGAIHKVTSPKSGGKHDAASDSTKEPGPGTRHLRPRFIAAKDHFIDNPFIYSWVSLGKVIENAGMIFINRRKGKGWAAMEEAAEKLVNTDVEIAVYPQGTRAYSLKTPSEERLDAGFYTTFTKKTWDKPLGHLKPGTAYLILDTLIQLKKKGEDSLNIITIGIMGTGTAFSKGSMKIQTETEMEFRLATVWALPTSLAEGVKRPKDHETHLPEEKLYLERIEEIQEGINKKLLEATGWHDTLRERTKQELRKIHIPEEEINSVDELLKKSDQEGMALPFVLIDRIISLKPELWERFFRLLLSIKDQNFEERSWKALLQVVSERLLQR